MANGPKGAALTTERSGRRRLDAVAVQVHASTARAASRSARLFPDVAKCIDDICVIRSMHTNMPNHEPSLLMMNSGETQPTRPSLGSWLIYGLGTENQNLPGFVVLCPGKPVGRPAAVEQQFPARHLPGHAHQQLAASIRKSIIQHISNRYLPPAAQRQQLDLLRKLNEMHLEEPRQGRPAGGAHPVAGDGLPHAVRRPGGLRSVEGDGGRRESCTATGPSPTAA